VAPLKQTSQIRVLRDFDLWWAASETAIRAGGPTRHLILGVHRKYRPCADTRKRISAALSIPLPPPAQCETLSRGWEALLGVVAACGVTRVAWGSRRDNLTRVGLSRLALWLLRMSAWSGVGYTMSVLKQVAADARQTVIETVPPSAHLRFVLRCLPWLAAEGPLEQLSYLGRALPEGDGRVARRALLGHAATLSTPHVSPPELLVWVRRYVERFASRFEPLEEFLPSSPSASVGRGRRAGGTREEVRQSWLGWLRETGYTPPGLEDSLATLDPSDEGTMVVLSNLGAQSVARAAARLSMQPLGHRVCCVPERGWKQRIVSAPPPYASVAGTVLNKALLHGLRKERRCRRFLEGERRLAIEEVVSHSREGWVVNSTDLSSASDRLPLDLVEAVVDGLILGWKGLPPVWSEALRSLTGPQLLTYPNGRVVNSERGVLMGLGPTWPILSLVHLAWVDYSASRCGARHAARFATAIGGDDLIACWPKRLVDEYSSTVAACGGAFSKGKAYLHAFGGNFTEITFWVVPGVPRPTVRWAGGIPLKGLVGTQPAKEGEAYESICSVPGREHKARRVLRALRPDAWRRLRESGVVPTVPRSLGGAGLPCFRGTPGRVRAPFWLRLAVGRYLYGSGHLYDPMGPPSWEVSRDPVSLAARRRAEQAFRQGIEFGLISVERRRSDPAAIGTVWKVVSKETALFSAAAPFGAAPLPASASGMAVPSRYARACRAWARRSLRGGVPDRLAVREGRSSRAALLVRARLNREEWSVVPLMEGVWPF